MLQDYNYVNGNIYHHLPLAGQNSQVTHALALVYEKMIGRYHSCVDQFPVGGEGGGLFNPGLCGCIGEYSVEDGLNDFFKNLSGVGTSEFVELFEVVMELEEELELTQGEVNWLLIEPNSDYAYEVSNYLNSNNLEHQSAAKEASKIYLNLLKNDPEFAELSAEFAAIPSFIWPFIREVAVEFAIELIKKHIPGVSDYNNVINAINNLQQGDMLGFLGEVLDIVKKKFPALAAIDLAIDGYNLTGVAAKAWKAYTKMEQFGGDVIERFTQVLVTHANGILGKFNWKSGVGVEISGVGSPEQFWDDLQSQFPSATILPLNQLAPYEIAGFRINGTGSGQIRFSIKYGGNSNPNGYTIEIKLGSNEPLKFRF